MSHIALYVLLGVGVGSIYALSALGVVQIYRGSGVLNFSQGAVGLVAAYVYWELHTNHGWAQAPAVISGVLASAVIGVVIYLGIMRPLRRASSLMRVVGTLAALITLQALMTIRYGAEVQLVNGFLPTKLIHFTSKVGVSEDRLIMLLIAVALAAALWWIYRSTLFGAGTSAIAENPVAAASLGWSPDVVALANWAAGSALSGFAAILLVPLIGIQVGDSTSLLLASLAAALVGSFKSFPLTLGAGLALGIAEVMIESYLPNIVGLATSAPVFVIVLVLVFRGRSLPLRDYLFDRLPELGSGKIHWLLTAVATVGTAVVLGILPAIWSAAIAISLSSAIVLLSIVVLTGYAGQISLAQVALAGVGAYIAGQLVARWSFPFEIAIVLGVVGAIPVGLLLALPAVRARGVNLAVITFAVGGAIEAMLFDSGPATGGLDGATVGKQSFFGVSVDPIRHSGRYAILVLFAFVASLLAVANLRRGRVGRRLIAVRTHERAATALGIDVRGAKLYAFALGASLASLGGILTAFQEYNIVYSNVFQNFQSSVFVGYAAIGGLGFASGPIYSAAMVPGGLGNQILNSALPGASKYVALIGGIFLYLTLLTSQSGVAREVAVTAGVVRARLRSKRPANGTAAGHVRSASSVDALGKVPQKTLEITGVSVTFGGTKAVDGLCLSVRPGEVVGLIGPNGAGKTTAIDAITGFVDIVDGCVELGGISLQGWKPVQRARAGIGRSFQSLELLEDLTVLDNLLVAVDPHDRLAYLADLVRPERPLHSPAVAAAIRACDLGEVLDTRISSLPYGSRRLVAIARAVAADPSILLLDEPCAGLGPGETDNLAELFRSLASNRGMGVLLVEHDVDFVMRVCDRIVVMNFGREIANGTPKEIRAHPEVVAAYFGDLSAEEREMLDAKEGEHSR